MLEPYNNKNLFKFNNIKDKIVDDFKNCKLHHATIFVGDRGIGKATLCYHIANKILDYNTTLKNNSSSSLFADIVDDNVLNDDNPTYNLIKNKKHPDLLVIEKEIDQKTSKIDKEIKVSSARKILDFVSLAPFVSKNKVVIIDSIDEMNISAQNAILKILEEPAKNTYIFLVCHNINNVLKTILSRCREIDIEKYNFDDWNKIIRYLSVEGYNNLDSDKQKNLYEISNGSISFAIDILKNDGIFLYEYIENLLSNNILDIESLHIFADKINNDEKLYFLFENFIQFFLYQILKYFSTNKINDTFKEKNYNFILKNNEKLILDKINFVKQILKDVKTFNLSKKHAIVVIFCKIF